MAFGMQGLKSPLFAQAAAEDYFRRAYKGIRYD
jgi:hypothetical protein